MGRRDIAMAGFWAIAGLGGTSALTGLTVHDLSPVLHYGLLDIGLAMVAGSLIALTVMWRTTDRPRYKRQLQAFYAVSGATAQKLLNPHIKDADVAGIIQDVNSFTRETRAWIKNHIGDAAAVKFEDRSGFTPGHHPWIGEHDPALAKGRFNAIALLQVYCRNLAEMITTERWDSSS